MQSVSSKQKRIVGIVLVCLVIIVAGLLIWRHNHHSSVHVAKAPPQAIIDITPSGFVPATLNVKSGTVVIWQNQDSATHKVASNPYPSDNSVPGLNSEAILPNGSYQYKPASGTIYYHDDTKPTLNGTIVVGK